MGINFYLRHLTNRKSYQNTKDEKQLKIIYFDQTEYGYRIYMSRYIKQKGVR